MENTKENQIKYRFGSVEDLDKLVSINIEDELKYKEIDQKMFSDLISQKKVFVALYTGEVAGLLYWRDDFLGRMNQWYLKQITVVKPYRKKGVGLGLLKYFLDYAKSQKVEKVFADVLTNNYPSLEMTLKSGGLISGFIEGMGVAKEKDERVLFRWELNQCK